MSNYPMDSDDDMLEPGTAAGAEFDLDESILEQMRESEQRIIAQQAAASSQSTQSSNIANINQPLIHNHQANNLSKNTGESSDQPSSHLTPARIAAATRTVVGVAFELSSEPGQLIRVKLTVFDRFIPHLVESLNHTIDQSHNDSAMIEDDDSDSDSDLELTGRELHLTGDREKDAATLRALMDESSEESDVEFDEPRAKPKRKGGNDMSDDEDEEGTSGPLKTRNEISLNELPPPAPFTVSPTDQLVACGTFMSFVDGFLIVEGQDQSNALDAGSAICLNDRTSVGRVEEIFGPVDQPMYGVRPIQTFSETKIRPEFGTVMYFVSSLSSFVLADTKPGSDASNVHDEEVAPEEAEYSDDEQEQQAKRDMKQAKAKKKNALNPATSNQSLPTGHNTQSSTQNGGFKAQQNKNRSYPRPPAPNQRLNNASFQPMQFPTQQQQFNPYQMPQSFDQFQQPGFPPQQFYPQQPGFAPQFYMPPPYGMNFPPQQQQQQPFMQNNYPQQQQHQQMIPQPVAPSAAQTFVAPPPGIKPKQ